MNEYNENLDDIDLNEVFNDFYEKPEQLLIENDFKKRKSDDLVELSETDCTAPRTSTNRKRAKISNKSQSKQMTMYDYTSSISCKYKQFYSSLDNTTSTKTVTKVQKRSLTDDQPSTSSSTKKVKLIKPFSSKSSSDFIDNLLRYLDERSRYQSMDNPSKSNF